MENHCFKNWKLYVWFFCVTCNHSHLVVGREKVKWASLSGFSFINLYNKFRRVWIGWICKSYWFCSLINQNFNLKNVIHFLNPPPKKQIIKKNVKWFTSDSLFEKGGSIPFHTVTSFLTAIFWQLWLIELLTLQVLLSLQHMAYQRHLTSWS